ncbi:uncharacterized protein ARMOST_18051 [Armillaria ostoyae]|uniref:Uncharacterized protein n=1 Tax=Armillaria ostoyae TaxID=47428 RepID=A0A284S0P6_ARMOS|nr:uncharacterized protein ARMOST_18051 [Armillaria ostoyae]
MSTEASISACPSLSRFNFFKSTTHKPIDTVEVSALQTLSHALFVETKPLYRPSLVAAYSDLFEVYSKLYRFFFQSFAKTKIIGTLVSTINLVVEIGTKYHRIISDVAEDLSAILGFSDTQRFILDPQLPPRYLANSQNLVSDISYLHLHVRRIVKAFNKRDLLTLVAGRTGRMVSYLCLAVGGALGAAQYILPGQFKGFLPASIASVVPRPLLYGVSTFLMRLQTAFATLHQQLYLFVAARMELAHQLKQLPSILSLEPTTSRADRISDMKCLVDNFCIIYNSGFDDLCALNEKIAVAATEEGLPLYPITFSSPGNHDQTERLTGSLPRTPISDHDDTTSTTSDDLDHQSVDFGLLNANPELLSEMSPLLPK